MDYQLKAQLMVAQYYNRRVVTTNEVMISTDEVYVVWFCKTLRNWKALLSTTVPDGMYYELSYNGDDKVTYLDAYKMINNISVPDEVLNESKFP
jgi:hypothetical protein